MMTLCENKKHGDIIEFEGRHNCQTESEGWGQIYSIV